MSLNNVLIPSPLAPKTLANSATGTVFSVNCFKVNKGFCSNKSETKARASWSYKVLSLLKCLAAVKIKSSSPALLPFGSFETSPATSLAFIHPSPSFCQIEFVLGVLLVTK